LLYCLKNAMKHKIKLRQNLNTDRRLDHLG